MKIAKRDTPLWGVYMPHFDQISVKISVLRLLYPNRFTDWGEIWHPPPWPTSPQSVRRVAPAGRKTSKSASEYIKYRRLSFAQCCR